MIPKFVRYFSFLMAVILLNCSVDAPDVSSRWHVENLDHNEQESIVELIVESGFGWGDVIPEQDDADNDDQASIKKNFSTDHFVLPAQPVAVSRFRDRNQAGIDSHQNLYPQDFQHYFSPPPES